MASVKRRPNGKWRARYRDEAGKEHSRHFGKKVEAERWLREVEASIVTGQYVAPDAGKITVRQYAASWEAQQVGGAAAARIVDNALRLHVLPELGDKPMRAVRRSHVQTLVKGLSDELAPGTVRNVYDVTAKLFAAAVYDRVIPTTPCERITLPKVSDVEVVPPTVEQVHRLAGAVDERYRAAVSMLAGSGLRIGELLGLRVSDVDFLRRTVRVERQRLQSGKLAPPKTDKSVRTVPLGQVVVDELAAHLAAFPSGEWLFTDHGGDPVPYWRWKRVWAAGLDRAFRTRDTSTGEVRVTDEAGAEMTSHDLRHFYASALIAGGASVKQVQTVLGHSSAAITLRVYSHLWPGDEDRTRSIIDAQLNVLRTGCGLSDAASSVSAGESTGSGGQPFLVSQKILSISAM
ncbi:site-specific integrase [Saccharopolyspora halophila]|uniref:Site-specific integrase n=1 Tax=Saccharopolyspora halophila TaxID=405551 RepID=A0ABN3GCS5_9PSEU